MVIKQLLKKYNRTAEEALALLGCVIAMMALFPFAVYRFLVGEYLLSAIEFGVIVSLFLSMVQNFRYKEVTQINAMLVFFYMSGFLLSLHLKGVEVSGWIYPVIVATYFFMRSRIAIAVNLLCMAITVPILFSHMVSVQLLIFYVTSVSVTLFTYILALRSEYQNAELRKLSTEDALTHVFNRRSLNTRLKEIIESHHRVTQKTSMLLFDLDHFKLINDTYGHPVGDKILVAITDIIKSNIRISDHVYRYGGEEFVIITNNTPLACAGKVAEFIRKVIEESPVLAKYHVTVSFGVAELSRDDDIDTWLHRADVALYEAKTGGRNIVYLAKPAQLINTYTFEPFSHYSSGLNLKKKRACLSGYTSYKSYLDVVDEDKKPDGAFLLP